MSTGVYKFPNESYSGADIVASCIIKDSEKNTKGAITFGTLTTISYSVHMDKRPVRSIGNVNVKDYVMGPRTVAGSLVFTVFNKHVLYEIIEQSGEVLKDVPLMDELPPFDIVITCASEYGYMSKLVLYNVRLVNEGQVMSINDIMIENTYQFVADDVSYLKDIKEYEPAKNMAGYTIDHSDIEVIKPVVDLDSANGDITSINYKTILTAKVINKTGSRYVVKIDTEPKMKDGYIVLKDYYNNEQKYPLTKSYIITELEAGKYSSYYMVNDEISSKVIDFTVTDSYEEQSNTYEPIVWRINPNNMTILCEKGHVFCDLYKLNEKDQGRTLLKTVKITDNKAFFEYNFNDWTYYVESYDNMTRSKTKTIVFKNTNKITEFKNRLYLNKNTLSYPIENYIEKIDNIQHDVISNGYSIPYALYENSLKENNTRKNDNGMFIELLLLSIDFWNEDNNKNNNVPVMKDCITDLINGTISIDEDVNIISIEQLINDNSVYIYDIKPKSKETKLGLKNGSYYSIKIYYNNLKSTVLDYYNPKEEEKVLMNYLLNIESNTTDLDVLESKYNTFKYIIGYPFYDKESNNILIDTKTYIDRDSTLCIDKVSSIGSIRAGFKINIMDELIKENYMDDDKYYALYVEDKSGNRISKMSFIKNDDNFINDNNYKINVFIKSFIKNVCEGLSKNDEEVASAFLVNENITYTNIYREFINFILDKNIKSKMLLIFNVFGHMIKNNIYIQNDIINKVIASDDNIELKFNYTNNTIYMYNINSSGIKLEEINCSKEKVLSFPVDNHYTFIIASEAGGTKRSGYVLIDNINKEIMSNDNLTLEVI